MIVKCKQTKKENGTDLIIDNEYCVLGITFYYNGKIDYNVLIKEDERYVTTLLPSSVFEIVDGRWPNTCVFGDWAGWQRRHLESLAFNKLKGDDIYENDNIGFINAVNEILEFHKWPLLEIPEYLLPEPTEEERRKNDLSDELESYLDLADKDNPTA